MSLADWIVADAGTRKGGQGTVCKVEHRVDKRVGALKRLHDTNQTARRYRFLAEVGALRAMKGNGVPAVLEANEQEWENPSAELYLVMDFVEGRTMQELVQVSPPTIDQAILATLRILEILGASHTLRLLHRDLKPDNVILRGAKWDDPVLVDFGIASYGDLADVEFRTPDGVELGNRFLRLPELAPQGDHHDNRSDVTMAAGLLFFMLSGRAPRTLVDENGLFPHEVFPSPMRRDVLEDARWSKLSRLFAIAFQQRIEVRFQTAQEFSTYLSNLEKDKSVPDDDLEAEIARYIDITNSAVARERTEAAPLMEQASRLLYDELTRIWAEVEIQQGGQHPTFKAAGATNEFYCVVSKRGQADPVVVLRHKIELYYGRLRASWSIDDGEPALTFEGSVADGEGLREAVKASARKLSGQAIRELTRKLTPPLTLAPFFKK